MWNCCRKRRNHRKKIVLLLVGLDNAGKTVAVKGLAGEDSSNSVPTVGFSVINLKHAKHNIRVYDLGGGPEIRGIWHRYFVDAHGIIFVIDSSDSDRLYEAKKVLQELLSHEKVSEKPVLLLANKQDEHEALDEIDIVDKLQLERLVNENRCPTLVESCSAKEISRNKMDPGIRNGYNWLINYITQNYSSLNARVEKDVKTQLEIDTRVRLEKMKNLNRSDSISSDNTDVVFLGDPFRPISELIDDKKAVSPVKSDTFLNNSTESLFTAQTKKVEGPRPKSAVQLVKKQLISQNRRRFFSPRNNKTAPVEYVCSKSAPVRSKTKISAENTKVFTVTDKICIENGLETPNKSPNTNLEDKKTRNLDPILDLDDKINDLELENVIPKSAPLQTQSCVRFNNVQSAPVKLENHEILAVTNLPNAVIDVNGDINESFKKKVTCLTLPNAIVDTNGDNIGDLFQWTSGDKLEASKRLPPLKIKTKNNDDCLKWIRKPLVTSNVDIIQIDEDESHKDIS